jgi:glycosyltransferase involved in cell wall biosynthesis
MRVLILHSRYASGAASGENHVVDDEARLLRQAGHHVITWTPQAPASPGKVERARLGAASIRSPFAERQVRALAERHLPDVVHVHNLFPLLSPAVLRVVAGVGLPVVVTLHNYRLMCLPATFFRDGRPCEDCLGRPPWPGVVHRCYRSSAAGSLALATSLAAHRLGATFDRVDRFLAVSGFLRSKYVSAGFERQRIIVRPNFAWATERRRGPGEHFLYVGRLAPEKDVATLIRAFTRLRARLVIVGGGPDESALRAEAGAEVDFVGVVAAAELGRLLQRARAVIVPSLSYEGSPRAVVEAYAAGVPVIANDVGALPEFVADCETGMLVPPRDEIALQEAVHALLDDGRAEALGEGALASWAASFGPETALASLERVYEEIIRRSV